MFGYIGNKLNKLKKKKKIFTYGRGLHTFLNFINYFFESEFFLLKQSDHWQKLTKVATCQLWFISSYGKIFIFLDFFILKDNQNILHQNK